MSVRNLSNPSTGQKEFILLSCQGAAYLRRKAQVIKIIDILILPTHGPRADGWFRYGCVLYEWLGWQESVWSGPLIAPRPHAFGCCVHSHSGLCSAAATRVRHLSVMGSLSDGGCADASGMLSWYRVSSFLLNHDPGATQARCSPEVQRNAYIEPRHTRCLR